MKKVVGVMPLWNDRRKSIWMEPEYLEGIKRAGALPFVFPLMDDLEDINQLCELCDGFLFSGGHDVEPGMYGQEPLENVEVCAARDRLEKAVLDYALEKDKPVLGICRGIQLINAALGGTLYQDIPMQCPSSIEHNMKPPYDRTCHKVAIVEGSPLHALLRQEELAVNSYHHQAVKEPAEGLLPMALSEDGLIEGLYMPGKRFVWAVQWHPENLYLQDENSLKILKEFVSKC